MGFECAFLELALLALLFFEGFELLTLKEIARVIKSIGNRLLIDSHVRRVEAARLGCRMEVQIVVLGGGLCVVSGAVVGEPEWVLFVGGGSKEMGLLGAFGGLGGGDLGGKFGGGAVAGEVARVGG